jgi:hypothetical protein
MNHHHSPIQPAAEAAGGGLPPARAEYRKELLAGAANCLKVIYQRRRQMARFARFGNHVYAWQEYREILKAKDRRRWYLARAADVMALHNTEGAR